MNEPKSLLDLKIELVELIKKNEDHFCTSEIASEYITNGVCLMLATCSPNQLLAMQGIFLAITNGIHEYEDIYME